MKSFLSSLIHHVIGAIVSRSLRCEAANATIQIFAVVLCAGHLSVLGATEVSGVILNQTWTKARSPYFVVSDILVAGLAIDPGVEVLSRTNGVFEIADTLTAVGSTEEPIRFQSAQEIEGWQGIWFKESAAGSTLAHCRVEGSLKSGVRILNTPLVLILIHCQVETNYPRRSGQVPESLSIG